MQGAREVWRVLHGILGVREKPAMIFGTAAAQVFRTGPFAPPIQLAWATTKGGPMTDGLPEGGGEVALQRVLDGGNFNRPCEQKPRI